jgi:hypothetical protein
MPAELPIESELIRAFRTAIWRFYDEFRCNGLEPTIRYKEQDYSITDIATMVSNLNDPLPEPIYLELIAVGGNDYDLTERTFADGGRCLLRLYERIASRRARQST